MELGKWKLFNMAEGSVILQRLNKLCQMVGAGSEHTDPIVTSPTMTPLEFLWKIDRLLRVTADDQEDQCSKRPQLQQSRVL